MDDASRPVHSLLFSFIILFLFLLHPSRVYFELFTTFIPSRHNLAVFHSPSSPLYRFTNTPYSSPIHSLPTLPHFSFFFLPLPRNPLFFPFPPFPYPPDSPIPSFPTLPPDSLILPFPPFPLPTPLFLTSHPFPSRSTPLPFPTPYYFSSHLPHSPSQPFYPFLPVTYWSLLNSSVWFARSGHALTQRTTAAIPFLSVSLSRSFVSPPISLPASPSSSLYPLSYSLSLSPSPYSPLSPSLPLSSLCPLPSRSRVPHLFPRVQCFSRRAGIVCGVLPLPFIPCTLSLVPLSPFLPTPPSLSLPPNPSLSLPLSFSRSFRHRSFLNHLSNFSPVLMTSESASCIRCGNASSSVGSLPMSLHKVSSLNRSLAGSIPSSRGDSGCSSLELEAVAAMHELSFAVESICVSEMLPRTGDLIFVNVTTLEGQPYCLELTMKGWRIASLRSDCMIGDFTRLDLFTKYYDTLYSLLDDISPGYRERFGERLAKKLMMLQNDDYDAIAPSSSYCSPPLSMSSKGSTESLPVITPVPSPVHERERDDCSLTDRSVLV